jgi:large subunit ribosomal protein L35
MPKIKTRKSVAKRFKITKTGKVICRHCMSRHLKVKKSKKRIRRQKTPKIIMGKMAKKIKKMLGK